MTVKTVGSPPPESDQLRIEIEKQLPDIINSFTQILQDEYGFENLRVGGFTIVPVEENAERISCDEATCSVS